MSDAQMAKVPAELGAPGRSPHSTQHQSVSPYAATPHNYLDDPDFEDFSKYTAPAYDDDLFDSQFGPMLNLDDTEDSYIPYENRNRDDAVNEAAAQSRPSITVAQPSQPEHMPNDDGPTLDEAHDRQPGVDPDQRAALNQAPILTLHEQEEQRALEDKNANVERWLTKSTAGSDDEDDVDTAAKKEPADTDPMDDVESSSLPPNSYDDLDQFDQHSTRTGPSRQDSLQELPKKFKSRFWQDSPVEADAPPLKSQPSSSNAAIYRFEQRARDIETASRTATIGSRRRSLDSLFSAAGISVRVPSNDHGRDSRNRKTSLLDRVLPKRSNSNLKKRKGSQTNDGAHPGPNDRYRKEPANDMTTKVTGWGKPLVPGLDTTLSPPNASSALSPKSATSLAPPTSPWAQAKNVIRRTRSRTEADRPSLLASMWTQQGGPPVPTLKSPHEPEPPPRVPTPKRTEVQDDSDRDADGDDDGGFEDGIPKVQTVPESATYDGFKVHAQELNPTLPSFMIERITQEQMRRFKKLVDFRIKHLNAVSEGKCSSEDRCTDLGGGPKVIPVKSAGKTSDSPAVGFHIPSNTSFEDGNDQVGDGLSIAAHFPPGVPIPPVQFLPSEFECPLCFQCKIISKPSDWTKHVHEDIQPFTCTFPDCGEPKSFKRKADWVRHENERHRQLEKWVCNFQECIHVCYRKDNFVQHLVREHKLPEPRIRGSRSSGAAMPSGPNSMVQMLLQTCRLETSKRPTDEPCRFCGTVCMTWKKLTVHLAKHMEELSMPVLKLVSETAITKDTILSPVEERSRSLRPMVPSPSGRSSHFGQSRSISPGGVASRSPQNHGVDKASNIMFQARGGSSSQGMHTYPPPNTSLLHQQQYSSSIDASTIPADFVHYNYNGYNEQTGTNLTVDPHSNLLSPMDGSSYYGSYESSGSSNAYYELAEPTMQAFNSQNVTSNPVNPGIISQQPVFASPVDSNAFTFSYNNSQAYAPTGNSATYPQFPANSMDLQDHHQQQTTYEGSHAYVQQGNPGMEQGHQPHFQGSTYPPPSIPSQRSPSQGMQNLQAPPQPQYHPQGHYYGH